MKKTNDASILIIIFLSLIAGTLLGTTLPAHALLEAKTTIGILCLIASMLLSMSATAKVALISFIAAISPSLIHQLTQSLSSAIITGFFSLIAGGFIIDLIIKSLKTP